MDHRYYKNSFGFLDILWIIQHCVVKCFYTIVLEMKKENAVFACIYRTFFRKGAYIFSYAFACKNDMLQVYYFIEFGQNT